MDLIKINDWMPLLQLIATIGVGIAVVYATFIGPSKAVQDQKDREAQEKVHTIRQKLFYTLMVTRHRDHGRLLDRHVEALNMIGIEYYRDKDQDLTTRQKIYRLTKW